MKILIWLFCFFIQALITTTLEFNGIRLGAIPTFFLVLATCWCAKKLCKKWDNAHKKKKKSKKNVNSKRSDRHIQIKYCRKCRAPLIQNSKFCRKCGTEVI